MKRRTFLAGSAVGLAAGAVAGFASGSSSRGAKQDKISSIKAPAVVSGKEVGITWRVQTSWPTGIGLQIFEDWCNGIVEKTGGELAFQPFAAEELVGGFQLFDALKDGSLDAMNSFTLYWAGRMPVAVFLCSYPLAMRHANEWDVFYYGLGGLELAREAFAEHGMFYVGPIQHGPNIIHSRVPIRSIDDFRGRKIRMPGGIVAEVFQAAGAATTMMPGSKVVEALRSGIIDAADYVGPSVNFALGLQDVTKYISMGPPGFPSIYQSVDLMDLTVSMKRWNELPEHLKKFIEAELPLYSDLHHATIQAADVEAWKKFGEAGSVVNRLSPDDVEKFTRLAVPRWFAWANKSPKAAHIFKIQLDYMMSDSLGYVTPDMIKGLRLNYT